MHIVTAFGSSTVAEQYTAMAHCMFVYHERHEDFVSRATSQWTLRVNRHCASSCWALVASLALAASASQPDGGPPR